MLKKVSKVPQKVVRSLSQPGLAPISTTNAGTSVAMTPTSPNSGQMAPLIQPSPPNHGRISPTSPNSGQMSPLIQPSPPYGSISPSMQPPTSPQPSTSGVKRPVPGLIPLRSTAAWVYQNKQQTSTTPSLATQIILNRLNHDDDDPTLLAEQTESENTTIHLDFESFNLRFSGSDSDTDWWSNHSNTIQNPIYSKRLVHFESKCI